MRLLFRSLIFVLVTASVGACSHTGFLPMPIMERPTEVQTGVQYDEAEDLRTCRHEVRAAAPLSIQPRWLPPIGGTTTGIVLGTVDVPHPVWPSLVAYRQEIEHCLVAHGYQIRGWR